MPTCRISGSFLRSPSAQPSAMTSATLQAAHRSSLLPLPIARFAKASAGGRTILVGRCRDSVSSACSHRGDQDPMHRAPGPVALLAVMSVGRGGCPLWGGFRASLPGAHDSAILGAAVIVISMPLRQLCVS